MKSVYSKPEVEIKTIVSLSLMSTSIGVIGDEDTDEMLSKEFRYHDEFAESTNGWGDIW